MDHYSSAQLQPRRGALLASWLEIFTRHRFFSHRISSYSTFAKQQKLVTVTCIFFHRRPFFFIFCEGFDFKSKHVCKFEKLLANCKLFSKCTRFALRTRVTKVEASHFFNLIIYSLYSLTRKCSNLIYLVRLYVRSVPEKCPNESGASVIKNGSLLVRQATWRRSCFVRLSRPGVSPRRTSQSRPLPLMRQANHITTKVSLDPVCKHRPTDYNINALRTWTKARQQAR